VRRERRRKLTKAQLRALGATPGLMAHRMSPDGRARLEQLTAEGGGRREIFTRRLTNSNEATMDTKTSEGER
jgi:hypothetical protein